MWRCSECRLLSAGLINVIQVGQYVARGDAMGKMKHKTKQALNLIIHSSMNQNKSVHEKSPHIASESLRRLCLTKILQCRRK